MLQSGSLISSSAATRGNIPCLWYVCATEISTERISLLERRKEKDQETTNRLRTRSISGLQPTGPERIQTRTGTGVYLSTFAKTVIMGTSNEILGTDLSPYPRCLDGIIRRDLCR